MIGRVALWGTVIEHERGYRAENAKIIGFDDMMAAPNLDTESIMAKLRKTYRLD